MKIYFVVFILFLLASCSTTRVIYMVRHAEKADNSRDPDLSEAGKQRAALLSDLLKDEKIKLIYSTAYKRTQQTGQPLADRIGLSILSYKADSLNAFATELLKLKKNALVVGHSNSTITLLDALQLDHKVKVIDDSDYGNLFKLTLKGKGKILEEKRY